VTSLPATWSSALVQSCAVPLLMLADYFLTLRVRTVLEKEYLKRFQVAEYELNPLWRKDVGRLRWFNPRHLCLVLLMWVAVATVSVLARETPGAEFAGRLLLGALVTPFALVVGRHLANLATGWRLLRHPEEVRGAVQLDLSHLLATSRYQVAGALLPLAAAAFWVRDPFLWGSLAGGLALVAAHYRWARKGKSVRSPSGPPPAP